MAPRIEQKPDSQNSRPIPYLGFLKVAVVVMGVMIIAGVGVIVVTIAKRASSPSKDTATTDASQAERSRPAPSTATEAFGEIEIDLPPGFVVIQTLVSGDRLVVETHGVGGAVRYLVLDLTTGERLGSFHLRAPDAEAPPSPSTDRT